MRRGDDLSERLLEFAARTITLAEALKKTQIARHLALQLVRSATSAGANYEEARGAESDGDFAHKLLIALKEIRESLYWLRLVRKANMQPAGKMELIITEAEALTNILAKSVVTTKRNAGLKVREAAPNKPKTTP